MTNLVIGLLSALLSSNAPAAASNLIEQSTGVSVTIPNPNDPVEREYQNILNHDDSAIAAVADLMATNTALAEKGQGSSQEALTDRVQKIITPVRQEYESFVRAHPDHVRGHIAFGSFLEDIHEDDAAKLEYETALKLDPKNPAAWNDLGNVLSHTGPVEKMFEYYSKAIEFNPREPVYYVNLATCVFLYRTNACDYFGFTNTQQVFDLSLRLYQKAFQYDPTNLALATEIAQTYYGIIPVRTDDALNAWTNALHLAKSDFEQQSVYVHLARFKLNAERFTEARADIAKVNDPNLLDLKNRILRNLDLREKAADKNPFPPPRIICPSGRRY